MTDAEYRRKRRDSLSDKYSNLFEDFPCDWEFQNGWDEIVGELLQSLTNDLKDYSIHNWRIIKMKELRGTLTFLYNGGIRDSSPLLISKDVMEKLEDHFLLCIEKSSSTCEFCGANGSLRSKKSWIATLCNQCAADNDY